MDGKLSAGKQVHERPATRPTSQQGEPVEDQLSLEDTLKEVKETDLEKLSNKYNFKLVCKICFRGTKTQTEKPANPDRCPTHNGEWIPLRIHNSSLLEIRPLPKVENPNNYKFGWCQSHQERKCGRKEQCWRAHNEHEYHLWRAEQAILYPRPCPPPQCTYAPRLCKDLYMKKKCQLGLRCFGAHSEVELRLWQMRYQKTKEDSKTIPWKTELEDAVEKAVLYRHTTDKLMEIHRKCSEISTNYKAELGHVVKVATNALVQHEIGQKESTAIVTPSTLQQQHCHHHHHTSRKDSDCKCPFMPVAVDYALLLEDQLSLLLQNVINEVDLPESSVASATTNSFIDEGQCDLRKLLSLMKEHTHHYATLFEMDKDVLYCYCIFLKQIGNELAHKVYLMPQGQKTESSLHVAEKTAYVEVYLEYGCDMSAKIIQSAAMNHQKANLELRMKELERIWKSFQTYCQCKKRYDVNRQVYNRLLEREQEQVSEEVVKQLQECMKTDKCCQAMLGTYIPALAEIDITSIADGVSSSCSSQSIQDKPTTCTPTHSSHQ